MGYIIHILMLVFQATYLGRPLGLLGDRTWRHLSWFRRFRSSGPFQKATSFGPISNHHDYCIHHTFKNQLFNNHRPSSTDIPSGICAPFSSSSSHIYRRCHLLHVHQIWICSFAMNIAIGISSLIRPGTHHTKREAQQYGIHSWNKILNIFQSCSNKKTAMCHS